MKAILLLFVLFIDLSLGCIHLGGTQANAQAKVVLDAHSAGNGLSTWNITTSHPNELIIISAGGYGTGGDSLDITPGTVTVNGHNATYLNEGLWLSQNFSWNASIWAYMAPIPGTYTCTCTETGLITPYYFNFASSVYQPNCPIGLNLSNIVIGGTDSNHGPTTISATITTTEKGSWIYGTVDNNDNGATGTVAWNGQLTETDNTYISDGVDGAQADSTYALAGTYTITSTDIGASNVWMTIALIAVQPNESCCNLADSAAVLQNIKCNGQNTGSAIGVPLHGHAPYTYSWSPGGQTTATATGLSAGKYTITISDTIGCSASSSVTITQPTAITYSVTSSVATCIDTNGAISVSAKGGTPAYTYLWNPGGGSNSTYTRLSSGTYTVTITDANGCEATTSGFVGINKTFSVSVSISGHDTLCKGQSTILNASGATSYLWSQGSTLSSVMVSPASTTTYKVIGTTGVCSDTVSYKVSVYPPLDVSKLQNDSICPGQPVTLKVTTAGGKPPYTYVWNNGITNNSPGPITVSPKVTITYNLLVTDGCNYTALDSEQITVVPVGKASFLLAPDTVTNGERVTFTNTSTGSTYYVWSFGNGGVSGATNPTYAYADTGIYQVILIAYNALGCFDSATADVYVEHRVIFPNVFTPNGDGVNDVFYFTILGAQCFHCDIYNRWGKVIYQIDNIKQGWDGKIQSSGDLAPDGTYYYLINYCNYDNTSIQLAGFLELIGNKK